MTPKQREAARDTMEFQLGMLFQEHGVGGDMKFKEALLDWCERQIAYATGKVPNRLAAYKSNGFTPEPVDD